MTIEIDASEAQLALLGMAVLALQSPGFDYALRELAAKFGGGRAVMLFDQFKESRRDITPAEGTTPT